VRPLPYVNASTTGAITRRHAIVKHEMASVPMISLVGGKLTTMRSLAESAAGEVLKQLGRATTQNSREWPVTGALDCPVAADSSPAVWDQVAARVDFPASSVAAVWRLHGSWTDSVLSGATPRIFGFSSDRTLLDGTVLPCQVVRYAIHREQARTLSDLVERRLMLLYHQRLTKACLRGLAELLAEAGRLPPAEIEAAVAAEITRLNERYGKRVE
jgi:glycerol-3-phosphate dehydrogenase